MFPVYCPMLNTCICLASSLLSEAGRFSVSRKLSRFSIFCFNILHFVFEVVLSFRFYLLLKAIIFLYISNWSQSLSRVTVTENFMAYSFFHWFRKREYLKRMTSFNLEDCLSFFVLFFFKLKMPRENKHLYFLHMVGNANGPWYIWNLWLPL